MLTLFLLVACDSPAPKDGAPPPPPGAPGPPRPPQPGGPPTGAPPPGVSGVALQDPSGFPPFHDWPAPPGPAVPAGGAWSAPVKLSEGEGGGYRPQIAASGTLRHVVFYAREAAGDLIRHRVSEAGGPWSAAAPAGFPEGRNWGPDLVARADGSLVMVFDHARKDGASRGWLTTWRAGTWSAPEPLTEDDGGEIGSGHVADGPGDDLAYVWIGKPLDPSARFRAFWRWRKGGAWTDPVAFTDGTADAWHTNVERRPDGSVMAGWDVGTGGMATTLYAAEGRDGAFGAPEDLTATGRPGERPHYAFGADGVDHVTWFHKEAGKPTHVYVRSGRPGAWGPVQELSAGYGGFHFDPEIAINTRGERCVVWGWDSGQDAELVYSIDAGQGWSPPRKVADLDWGKPGLASLVADEAGAFQVVWNQGIRGKNEVYGATLGR